ncbi:hypothetical protein [Pleomorphomonas oryzae]|uniref:hypothetical protein n=1 Tax=Pleomorphomonas oryzae TaxID=261934 RepID=UPI00041FE5E9|nr:hypothetical protein [Pleomorphomonas oryzae]
MYRALIFAVNLLAVSGAHGADAYTVNFPSLFDIPIYTATCDGLDLPCSANMASYIYNLEPFKPPLSLLRASAAPAGEGNKFGFVEVADIDHGKEDYDKLQGMIGQTSSLIERLWVKGLQISEREEVGKQFRLVRAVLPSKKAKDAIALCAFSDLDIKASVPNRCVLLSFRIDNRNFLLASVGLSDGPDELSDQSDYGPSFFLKWFQPEDPKAKILKSRHELERKSAGSVNNIIDNLRFRNNLNIRKKNNNFSNEATNGSKIEYSLFREWILPLNQKAYFNQMIELHFHVKAGNEWEAYYTDGAIGSGIELQGDTRDWGVTLDWEVRTVLNKSAADLENSDLDLLREPKATGADIVRQVRARFLDAMREICLPAKNTSTDHDESPLRGYLTVECGSD